MAKKKVQKINLFDATPLNEKLKKVDKDTPEDPDNIVDTTGIKEGATVRHDRFGQGKVLKVEGEAPNTKATISFLQAGEKTLLLKFAKLTVVPRK